MRIPGLTAAVLAGLVGVSAAGVALGQAPRTDPPGKPAKPRDPTKKSEAVLKAEEVLKQAFDSGNAGVGRMTLETMVDEMLVASDLKTEDELSDLWAVCSARRFLVMVSRIGQYGRPTNADGTSAAPAKPVSVEQSAQDEADRRRFLISMKSNPRLVNSLARVFDVAEDDARGVLEVASKLASQRTEKAEQFPELAAALCVVHDRARRTREGVTIDPIAVFDHFANNSASLIFKADELPAELLVHVVDVDCPISDLKWALDYYSGHVLIGKAFFDVPYDYDFFKTGRNKKLDGKPYTLGNIRQLSGICVDQAYFAAEVAKGIGVPSVVQSAPGQDVGHAWVGYFRKNGKMWDLTEGRYEEYKGQRGSCTQPQTGKGIADGDLIFTAQYAAATAGKRERAVALFDAAQRIDRWIARKKILGDVIKVPGVEKSKRDTDAATMVTLLEASVNQCPAFAPAWNQVAAMASADKLTPEVVQRWGNAMGKLCGPPQADFAVAWLGPMIAKAGEPAEQVKLWEWVYEQFVNKISDRRLFNYQIASEIRFHQADAWLLAGQSNKAFDLYMKVIREFRGEGRSVAEAVSRCDKLLVAGKRPISERVDLWRNAFITTPKPKKMGPEFVGGSSWAQLGRGLAKVLIEAGKQSEAEPILKQIEAATRPPN